MGVRAGRKAETSIGVRLGDGHRAAGASHRVRHPAGNGHCRRQRGRIAHRQDGVRRRQRGAVQHDLAPHAGERGIDADPIVVDLERLGAGVAEFLDGIEKHLRRHRAVGIGDGDVHSWALGGDGPGEDAQRVSLSLRLRQRLGGGCAAAAQSAKGGLQVGDLGGEFVLAVLQRVQQCDQIPGTGTGERIAAHRPVHLHGERESEQCAQRRDGDLDRDRRPPRRCVGRAWEAGSVREVGSRGRAGSGASAASGESGAPGVSGTAVRSAAAACCSAPESTSRGVMP